MTASHSAAELGVAGTATTPRMELELQRHDEGKCGCQRSHRDSETAVHCQIEQQLMSEGISILRKYSTIKNGYEYEAYQQQQATQIPDQLQAWQP